MMSSTHCQLIRFDLTLRCLCSIASYINEIFYLVVRKQDCALNQLEVDINENCIKFCIAVYIVFLR